MQDPSYFLKWNKQPTRTVIAGPSYVQAIVKCVDRQNNTFLTVVCRNGEIIVQSAENLSATEWSSVLKPPVDQDIPVERFQIEYAVYDTVSDCFLFVLHSPGDKEVYWAARQSLASDAKSTAKAGVRLQTLISTAQNNNRSFCGLAVDVDRRIIYTCNYELGKIDLWRLIADANESLKIDFIGAVNCRDSENLKMEPWYCAVFFLKQNAKSSVAVEGDGKLLLAVCDWESSSVFLYENSDKKTAPFTAIRPTNGTADDNMADMGFRYVGIIANASDEDKELGTVTFPHEMCFDNFGNLLVADAVNDRLQMFKLGNDGQFQALWASDSSCYHDRAVVIRDPALNCLVALANHFETVVCYE